jgi:predicted DNA-binding protein
MSSEDRTRVNLTISEPLRRYLEMRAELTGKTVATIANEILSTSMVSDIEDVSTALQLLKTHADTTNPNPTD